MPPTSTARFFVLLTLASLLTLILLLLSPPFNRSSDQITTAKPSLSVPDNREELDVHETTLFDLTLPSL